MNLIKMQVCTFVKLVIWQFEKRVQERKTQGKNQRDTYYFNIDKCKVCPLREECYKEGTKTIAVTPFSSQVQNLK